LNIRAISCFVHPLPFEFFLLFDPWSRHNQALVHVSPEFTISSFEWTYLEFICTRTYCCLFLYILYG
jgi:hypothetical protein